MNTTLRTAAPRSRCRRRRRHAAPSPLPPRCVGDGGSGSTAVSEAWWRLRWRPRWTRRRWMRWAPHMEAPAAGRDRRVCLELLLRRPCRPCRHSVSVRTLEPTAMQQLLHNLARRKVANDALRARCTKRTPHICAAHLRRNAHRRAIPMAHQYRLYSEVVGECHSCGCAVGRLISGLDAR